MIDPRRCRVRIELVEVHETGAEVILERRTTTAGTEDEGRTLFEAMYDAGLTKR